MKKILLITTLFLLAQLSVFADEIIDASGNVTECKIVTVSEGLIEYDKDGSLFSFVRNSKDNVFNDYVDFVPSLKERQVLERVYGTIIYRDFKSVLIKTKDGNMQIPWYRIRLVGLYRPN